MLYTCCNASRNTWQGCCGYANTSNVNSGCYGANVTNTNGCGCCTNTPNTNGGGTTLTNGVYGVFFPIYRPYCQTRTNCCGTNGGWTNGCCGCRQNLCTTNSTPVVIDGDAYYARQYGLYNGCGCAYNYCGYTNTTTNNTSTNN